MKSPRANEVGVKLRVGAVVSEHAARARDAMDANVTAALRVVKLRMVSPE